MSTDATIPSGTSSNFKQAGRATLVALTLSCLWFVPYLKIYLTDLNRYFYLWTAADAAALTSLIVAVAAGILVVGMVLQRLLDMRFAVIAQTALVFGFVGGVLNNLPHEWPDWLGYKPYHQGRVMIAGWMGLMMLVGWMLSGCGHKLAYAVRQVCLVLSPGAVILIAQLFRPTYYHARIDPLPATPAEVSVMPVNDAVSPTPPSTYFFVFDMWSHQRTFKDGHVRADLPNLAALAEQATVFSEARSQAGATAISLPCLLHQTHAQPNYHGGQVGFESPGSSELTLPPGGLFPFFKEHGYHTFLVGFSLPYAQWVPDGVDAYRSYSWIPHGEGMGGTLFEHIFGLMQKTTDPFTGPYYTRHQCVRREQFVHDLHQHMKHDVETILRNGPAPTFMFVHYPLPHDPFIYDAAGRLREPNDYNALHLPDNYETNLYQLDRHVGDFLAILRDTGRFDNSLIVMTADHTWWWDPNRKVNGKLNWPMQHVPLIIKLPGQREAVSIETEFNTVDLMTILAPAISSGLHEEDLHLLLNRNLAAAP